MTLVSSHIQIFKISALSKNIFRNILCTKCSIFGTISLLKEKSLNTKLVASCNVCFAKNKLTDYLHQNTIQGLKK